jgi:hypothetical protein
MSETTQIHPEKVRAYLATDYRLGHSNQDIVLTIDKHSELLATSFTDSGVTCGAFLTAYNPRGTEQSKAANVKAHAELAANLRETGLPVIEGSGNEKGSKWPAERSYFALGMALERAEAIGRHFDQDAIVWVGADAIPLLVLLR